MAAVRQAQQQLEYAPLRMTMMVIGAGLKKNPPQKIMVSSVGGIVQVILFSFSIILLFWEVIVFCYVIAGFLF